MRGLSRLGDGAWKTEPREGYEQTRYATKRGQELLVPDGKVVNVYGETPTTVGDPIDDETWKLDQ